MAGGAVLIVCCPPAHIAIGIVANVKAIVQTEIQVTCLVKENCGRRIDEQTPSHYYSGHFFPCRIC